MNIIETLKRLFGNITTDEDWIFMQLIRLRSDRHDKNTYFRMYCDVTYFTRQEIANHLNVSKNTVNRWYTGMIDLPLEKEIRIVKELFVWEGII